MTPDSFDEPMDDTTRHTLPGQTQDAPTLERVRSFVYLESTLHFLLDALL